MPPGGQSGILLHKKRAICMKVFSVPESQVKDFMQHLFNQDTFAKFQVRGIVVHSFTHFEISGEKGEGDFCTWGELRPYVRNIIKGTEKPRIIKIIFALEAPEATHPNAAALFINVLYDNDKINCTTACSQKSFELNRDVDIVWDNWVTDFFRQNSVPFVIEP